MHLCIRMKQTIEIKRNAHYYVQETIHSAKHILFVIHGYGQLAEEFIQEFNALKEESILVIAPEAISKFYNKDRKAVANWMTSHERLDEINDYVLYLNAVREKIIQDYGVLPFSVLGFSQGVSTALRWVCNSALQPSSFYACSGSIPPELERQDFVSLSNSLIFYYYGNRDRLLLPEHARKQIEILKCFELVIKEREYEGRHEVSLEAQQDIITSI